MVFERWLCCYKPRANTTKCSTMHVACKVKTDAYFLPAAVCVEEENNIEQKSRYTMQCVCTMPPSAPPCAPTTHTCALFDTTNLLCTPPTFLHLLARLFHTICQSILWMWMGACVWVRACEICKGAATAMFCTHSRVRHAVHRRSNASGMHYIPTTKVKQPRHTRIRRYLGSNFLAASMLS